MDQAFDVIIIGAGAAGMMCALTAGARGRRVLLIEHSAKLGEKIRISGGGRCNFTNIHAGPQAYISSNPHFCKSALAGFTQGDFAAMIQKHGIAYHEKTLGQLFCDESAQQVIDMLLRECEAVGATFLRGTSVSSVAHNNVLYEIETDKGLFTAPSLVIATGGLSIPKIGATKFGYDIAKQFGLNVLPTRAGLVPLTFTDDLLGFCKDLSGVSLEAVVSFGKTSFREALLFTHRGLSGPSILQISSYWREGQPITINLAPDVDVLSLLKEKRNSAGKSEIQTVLAEILPKRLAQAVCDLHGISGRLADLKTAEMQAIAGGVNAWAVLPAGTEGYRTAEVTLGGVDTAELSSKTMEAKAQPGLYFIGEVVDVTGHLGGYNFQWAWSSGYAAGQAV